jgi:hypothetical protein
MKKTYKDKNEQHQELDKATRLYKEELKEIRYNKE